MTRRPTVLVAAAITAAIAVTGWIDSVRADATKPGTGPLRQATFEVFAPEFAALSDQAREELADAIGAALSLDAWIVLRRRDGLSLERAVAVWRLTLTALLAQAVGTKG